MTPFLDHFFGHLNGSHCKTGLQNWTPQNTPFLGPFCDHALFDLFPKIWPDPKNGDHPVPQNYATFFQKLAHFFTKTRKIQK